MDKNNDLSNESKVNDNQNQQITIAKCIKEKRLMLMDECLKYFGGINQIMFYFLKQTYSEFDHVDKSENDNCLFIMKKHKIKKIYYLLKV